MTINGKTDNHGNLLPPSISNATAITYDLCVSQCGAGQEPFQWTVFSQQFSSWLLPWLALVSQLPFGANDNDNLESMLLTMGSPTLAAYSLALTVLNGRWIAQLFSNYRYPNVKNAVRILSGLQQSPLRVDTDDVLLASLIMLPQNDEWWAELVVWLEYTHTWSISAATSIAWVIIAYIFTIIDYFSQGVQDALNSNGGSIGSLWLWLLPVVVGWLQLSPKCDSNRLHQAVDRANSIAYVANQTSQPIKAENISRKRAIYIARSELDEARLDERSTPPIYNYARFLPWVQAVVVVSDAFGIISERDHHHDPVVPGTEWWDRNSEGAGALTALQVQNYSLPRPGSVYHHPMHKCRLDSSVISRMFIASALALTLQWGATVSAVIIIWFKPPIGGHYNFYYHLSGAEPFITLLGLGCRSASYITYGALSTLVWMMLLTSSILTYYSTNTPTHSFQEHFILALQARVARWLSIFLRRLGKLIAGLNGVWIVAIGLLQFSSFYDRCYCNSGVMGLGKHAYDVISPVDVGSMRTTWIGGFFLAAGAAMIFAGFVTLFIDPPLPR
jgi:hypothetical protein